MPSTEINSFKLCIDGRPDGEVTFHIRKIIAFDDAQRVMFSFEVFDFP
jgi:hypothetical protein